MSFSTKSNKNRTFFWSLAKNFKFKKLIKFRRLKSLDDDDDIISVNKLTISIVQKNTIINANKTVDIILISASIVRQRLNLQ